MRLPAQPNLSGPNTPEALRRCEAKEAGRSAAGASGSAPAASSIPAWQTERSRCEPTRQFRLSRKTLVRAFYQWRNGGCAAAALAFRYRPRKKLSAARLARFVRQCLTSKARSFRAAMALHGDTSVTASAYSHALPPALRVKIAALFRLRRQSHFAARKLLAAMQPKKEGAKP